MTPDGRPISQAYDEINARGYGAAYLSPIERSENRFLSRRIRRSLKELGRELEAPPRVLDVGCGTGEFLREHLPCPSAYIGLDFSRRMISEARRNFPAYASCFRCADFLNYEPVTQPHLIVALWGPFNYAGFAESVEWSAKTLAEGGRLCAVVYSSAHYYRDQTLYPPSVVRRLRDTGTVSRPKAEAVLERFFPDSARSVIPFSSALMARDPDAGYWRWTYDRLSLSVDYARDSRYLLLEVHRP